MQNDLDDLAARNSNPLVVIPCLNEALHIAGILRQLEGQIARLGGRIVVVDGGSTDGTQDIVDAFVDANPQISILHNPDRIQSAAVNLAVKADAGVATHLIRIDAHCRYPDDFCEALMQQALSVYADSIVVSMIAEGSSMMQRINAVTQNSAIGNGGSKHRMQPGGEYVDHGHHALIKIAAFQTVGGYDPSFSHNEDAELDYRLRQAGYRIWLTQRPVIGYFPRRTLGTVARQYFNYGAGRARNLVKHSVMPRLRQTKVMLVLPAVLMAPLAGVHIVFAGPAALWVAFCFGTGIALSRRQKDYTLLLCGVAAIVMHFSWSLGFWQRVLRPEQRLAA